MRPKPISSWANTPGFIMKRLERAGELVINALEALLLLGERAGRGEEVAFVAAGAPDGQFIAGQADLAPVLSPLLIPFVGDRCFAAF